MRTTKYCDSLTLVLKLNSNNELNATCISHQFIQPHNHEIIIMKWDAWNHTFMLETHFFCLIPRIYVTEDAHY